MNTREALCAAALPQRYEGCHALDLRIAQGILAIGLMRPEKRNSINVEMTLELERTLLIASNDAAVKVVVFHGAGGNFSSGMDMKDFFDHTSRDAQVLRRARAATDHWRARLLREMPQAIVCAVEGWCLGGALPLLECADAVFASATATFGLPEINFGFVPGGPIAKSMRQALGWRATSYCSLSGRTFDAAQARRWGLVTQVAQDGDCLDEALDAATDMVAVASNPSTRGRP